VRRLATASILLAVSACTTATGAAVQRGAGRALGGLRREVQQTVATGNAGRLAGPDLRPMVLDLRDGIRSLPRTLRLDTPPFADHHSAVRLAGSDGSWQPSTVLSRAFGKLPW